MRGVLKWTDLRREFLRELRFEPSIQIDIVRHGETVTNAANLVTGAQDVDLTPRGREQARVAGKLLLGRYDLAISSSLRRSVDTLDLMREAGRMEFSARFSDERLNERSLGALEMGPAVHLPEFAAGDLEFAPPGGDSYALVARRCLSFFLDVLPWAASCGATRILLCTHMGPMRILVGILDRDRSAAEVLHRSFQNTDVVTRAVTRLTMPPFLYSARG